MDATTSATSFQRICHPSLALPLTVPVPVRSQPHSHPRDDIHANAHAHAKPYDPANGHIYAFSDPNAHLEGSEAAWPFNKGYMSEYDEREEHESDVSRPQDDQSARASSVTTPDNAVPRLPPQQSLDFKQSQIFDRNIKGYSPPPPPDYKPDSPVKPLFSGILRPPPPHPPPPPPPSDGTSLQSQRASTVFSYYREPPPPPPPPPLATSNDTRILRPPPPPPPSSHDNVIPRDRPAMYLPESPSSQRHSPTDFLDLNRNMLQETRPWMPVAPLTAPSVKNRVPSFSTSDERSHESRRRHFRRRSRRQSTTRSSGSSTYSRTRPSGTVPSDSDSSEEDPIVFRNARNFPPLLPTYPAFGSPGTDSKLSVTNRITAWVAQYEGSRSPRKLLPTEAKATFPSESSDAERDVGSNESEASEASSVGEIEVLWTKLKEKRAKLLDMKGEMAKRRKELRDLRRKKDDADNAFMSVIRPMLVNPRSISHTPPSLLERRLGEMQSLRTEYHFQEANYEGLEVILDEEEAELNSLETRFFSLLGAGHTKPQRHQPDRDSEIEEIDHFRNMPLILKGISPDGPPENRHPLYISLLSAVGDLENLKEELEDLLFVQEQYDYDVAVNGTPVRPEDEEEKEFRAEFPLRKQQFEDNIKKLQKTVSNLRKQCEEKGAFPKQMSSRAEYLIYPEREYEDMDLDDDATTLDRRPDLSHHRFSVLLSQPEHVLAKDMPYTPFGALRAAAALPDDDLEKKRKVQVAAKEYAIDRLVVEPGQGGKTESVNRWLLHQLRTSPLNALILYLTFLSTNSLTLKIRDFCRWQNDVLYYWWRDDADSLGEGSENSSKLMTSQGSQCASRIGTSPRSRRASEGSAYEAPRRQLTRGSDITA